MKQVVLLSFGYASTFGLLAQSPTFITAWQPAGQPLISEAVAVTTDDDGYIYTAGQFIGTGDFDPGPGVVTLTSPIGQNYDAFVTKMNAAGELIWARNFGGTNHEWVTGIVVDSLGNVITCGHYDGIADMDPGPADYELPYGGSSDIFINMLDANGNFVYGKGIGAEGHDAPYGMVKGPDDMIYIGGIFGGDMVDFGSNILQTGGVNENYDGFILKMYPEGGIDWAKRIGNDADDYVIDLDLDPNGNIIFTGTFVSGSCDFDPSTQWATLAPVGLKDAFVCKWNNDGVYQWAFRIGSEEEEFGQAITTDAEGNIYVGGTFEDACEFDMWGNGYALSSAGNRDAFIAKYDPDGVFHWAKRMGGDGWDEVRDIQLSASSDVIVSGFFTGTVDMDPGASTQSRTAVGITDLFVLGLNASGTYDWDIALGSGNSDLTNGLHSSASGELFAVGRHDGDIDFDFGPGTHMLNSGTNRAWALRLGVCTPVEGPTTTATACDSYAWEGNMYTTGGLYYAVHPSSTGCDSTVTLDLTVRASNSSSSTASACDNYVWNGTSYTASGSYDVVLTNAAGCDSTATLHLTIATVNTGVAVDAETLIALLSGAAYQWVDCNNGNEPIIGATGQSFTAEENGSYAVEITYGICTVLSDCYTIMSTGLTEYSRASSISIAPNPGHEFVRIGTMDGSTMDRVRLIDATGRVVMENASTPATVIEWNTASLAPGIYAVECLQRGSTVWMNWMKH